MHIGEDEQKQPLNRYWDAKNNAYCIKIMPGEYYYTSKKEYIATTLGSCVSACIWDERNKIGGMNHFMLPLTDKSSSDVTWGAMPSAASRYGNYAMEYLINEMIKHGADKNEFKVKVFGGGKIIEGMGDVGKRNIDFILDYLKIESLNIISQDLGDLFARKVLFDPISGKAWVKKVVDENKSNLVKEEENYSKDICSSPESEGGDVDLF